MSVERVYLIRHGRTAWNAEGRWQGTEPLPLDDTGLAQARALAEFWQQPLTAIFSSDQLRAWNTATMLGDAVGLQPQADERLRECNLGIFQGLTKPEMQARYPVEFEQMVADYMDYCIPNGETRRALQARAYAAFMEITAHTTGHVAIVSHGGTLQVLLYRLFGQTEQLVATRYENTAITTLERQDGGWRLVALNETPHLMSVEAAAGANSTSEQMSAS